MSWYGHTLLPTVEGCFHGVRSCDLPKTARGAAAQIRKAGYHKEADYVEALKPADLLHLYEWAGLRGQEAESESDAWAMAEQEWGG